VISTRSLSSSLLHFPPRALTWLIPSVLFGASEAVLVSPWMEDVPLLLPPEVGRGLGDLLAFLEEKGAELWVFLRERDGRAEPVLARLKRATIRTVPDLHAKGIFTERVVLTGSANLLWSSVHRNVESVSLWLHGKRDALTAVREVIPGL